MGFGEFILERTKKYHTDEGYRNSRKTIIHSNQNLWWETPKFSLCAPPTPKPNLKPKGSGSSSGSGLASGPGSGSGLFFGGRDVQVGGQNWDDLAVSRLP